jgi:hypothetical protein
VKHALWVLWLAAVAHAGETTTLPKGTFAIDVSYGKSIIDARWDGQRKRQSLLDDLPRYEPGGGLQGVLSGRPHAVYDLALFQLLYGVTDWLTAAIYVPLVLRTSVDLNFRWTPGDYQSQLGRQYTEDDFWAWAASLGQPRPPSTWVGNRSTFADLILGARVAVPELAWLKWLGLRLAGTLTVALPTGRPPDPEEVVAAGTTSFDLHSYGDLEVHASWDRPFLIDAYNVPRLSVGGDFFYAWFRPKTLTAATGVKNPLLNTFAPYVGSTYTLDPGDWAGATLSLEGAPLLGPTFATFLSGRDLEKARTLPPLLTVNFGYTYLATGQSRWYSQSRLWDYEREKAWQPGDKNLFRFGLTLSLLRVGVPLQLYAQYRAQDLIPGRFTRIANGTTVGARVILKFW